MVSSMTASSPPPATASDPPDPQVRAMTKRRHFNAGNKLSLLDEADRCASARVMGAPVTQEGLSSWPLALALASRRRLGELPAEWP